MTEQPPDGTPESLSPISTSDMQSTAYDPKSDPTKYPDKPLPGWPEVAILIADTPDFQAFPSFRDLNIKSLLYYQAELTYLRESLHRAEYDDFRLKDRHLPGADKFEENLDDLIRSQDYEDNCSRKQWDLIVRIRQVLKEYNAALLQFSEMSELPEAARYNVESLRCRLKDVGENSIYGSGAHTWGDIWFERERTPLKRQFLHLLTSLFWSSKPKAKKRQEHLIVPRPGRKVDGFTLWVADEFVPFYQSLHEFFQRQIKPKRPDEEVGNEEDEKTNSRRGSSTSKDAPAAISCRSVEPSEESTTPDAEEPRKTLTTYSEAWILRITSAFATVVACLLPTVAIAVLAKVNTMSKILGIIALFTATFSIGLMCLTAGITRVEIFTATAAFSAVMVVFVQNQTAQPPAGS